jgi:Flp pilus assembly protein TadD
VAAFVVCFVAMTEAAPAVVVTIDDPDLAEGIKAIEREEYEEAVESLEKARLNHPDSAVPFYYLGVAYKNMQDFKLAAENLKLAMTMRPGVKDAIFDLAEMHFHMGDDAECLKGIETAEMEGVRPAETSFLKGLVFARLGRLRHAIAAFNKAKELDPTMAQAADYQTGLVLMKLGNLRKARSALKESIVVDPNSDLASVSAQYVEMINKRVDELKPIRLAGEVGYEYDDNVFLSPSDQAAAAEVTGEDDTRVVVSFRAEYLPRLPGEIDVKAQYSFYHSEHESLDSHDVTSHTVSVVPSYRIWEGVIDLLLSYNMTWVDDYEYLESITVSPGVTFTIADGLIGQAGVKLQHREYIRPSIIDEEDRDSFEKAAYVGGIYVFGKTDKGYLRGRYTLSREKTDGENWSYLGHRGHLSLSVPIIDKLRLNVAGEVARMHFDGVNTNFLKKRRDLVWLADIGFSYELQRKIDLLLKYTHTRSDSSIGVYDYEKNVAGASVKMIY